MIDGIINRDKRRLGPTTLSTYRKQVSIYKLHPNLEQPRPDWDKPDEELQRQILSNGGLWEPILVEPMADKDEEYLIIDGHRRWQSCKSLVEVNKQEAFETVPVEVIERPLNSIERMLVWIYIHRQRREWDAIVKEGVAYQLVSMVGKARSAEMLGLSLKEVDKLCEVYEFARDRFAKLPVADAGLTWAREILSLSARVRTPQVIDALVKKINDGLIKNSKDIRKLRQILRDSKATSEFMRNGGTIESAITALPLPPEGYRRGSSIAEDLDALVSVLQRYSWSDLRQMRGDRDLIRKLDEVEKLARDMKEALGGLAGATRPAK